MVSSELGGFLKCGTFNVQTGTTLEKPVLVTQLRYFFFAFIKEKTQIEWKERKAFIDSKTRLEEV